ncbi:MAG TPA: endonuclease/exonuclease/phosphatase family protein [Thermoleophilaceae bacterium]|jgi:endonuclease/exonuclease/phosphatase family metal-dependent hydrolase
MRRLAFLTLALAALAAAFPAGSLAAPVDLKVMTRNIYLGGNIFGPIGAPNQTEFRRRTGVLWAEVQHTDFVGTRAALLAKEVKRTKPDLIGLQEVALWRRGPDGVTDGSATPATTVVYDFLKAYQRALKRAGLRYKVEVVQQEADIEAPIDQGYDVRLTMRDAILVRKRKGLKITKRLHRNYKADISVPTPDGELTSTRGWAAVDGRLKGRKFRFVDTHLESAAAAPRNAQAAELVAKGGPLRVKGKPVIVVGDMNSDPNGTESDADAVNVLKGFGLKDLWPRIEKKNAGFSCCLETSDLSDTTAAGFDHRIDLIFSKPALRGTSGKVVGKRLSDRAANGLWPSDHAGVVLNLRLR